MSNVSRVSRRSVSAGLVAASIAAATGFAPLAALAQTATVDDWKLLVAMTDEARKLGLPVAQVSAPETGSATFSQMIPALLDFIDKVDDDPKADAKAVGDLKARASALLNTINARERAPRQKSDLPGSQLFGLAPYLPAFIASANAATPDPATRYERYKAEYIQLFESCVVRPDKASQVTWYVDKLSSPKNRSAYEKLEEAVCVPWYFIGVIHALETSFNFEAHLHNGDPLAKKTVHVPAGRPVPWQPPSDWQSSAKDALTIEKYTDHTDWNLAKLLFRLEGYNGFRSRELHSIHSPYLWSFSNHYSSGKFVADNQWSSSAVSQQCGAAVMIKELANRKLVELVA
jgi:lysozyme family protein